MKKLLLIILIMGCDNSTAPTDCFGIANGTAALDDCGVCDGGNADKDCAGLCNGTTEQSYCDDCDSEIFDCNGICDGSDIVDCAGECGGSAVLSGCDITCNSTAVVDCDGVCGGSNTGCSAAGTYTMTTYIAYNTSDCSGQGFDELAAHPDAIITLILNANGDATMIVESNEIEEPDYDYGSWAQSGNQVAISLFGDPFPFTLLGNTLTAQWSYESDSGDGYCDYVIFTK